MRKALLLTLALALGTLATMAQTVTSSPLPIILITTDNSAEIPDEPKIGATMKVLYVDDNTTNYIANQNSIQYLNYNGRIGIELRGSTSQEHSKKPYGFETRFADDSTSRNAALLGMPAENDWVLNAINDDKSYIRDCLSYALGRRMGRYAPRTKYCEVFVNGNYRGLYFLTEKIKIDDNRVNIAEMDTSDNADPDITGGYIVKADKLTGGDTPAWTTTAHGYWEDVNYIYHAPKPEAITTDQGNYIRAHFSSLQAAMNSNNSSIADGYPSIIDIPSWIDYMIMGELSSNVDIYQKSTFFYKDRRGKLCAGPLWDFNLAYGNDLGISGNGRSGYNIWQFSNGDNTGSEFWYQLFNDPMFQCLFVRRWHELTDAGGPLCYDSVIAVIDSLKDVVDLVVSRDRLRWGNWTNPSTNINTLKQWLQQRYSWINSQLGSCTACSNPVEPQLVISKIHYHPVATGGHESKDLEFIGIINADTAAVDLTGIYLRELGISYCFPVGSTLAAGDELYLASDSAAFRDVYGVAAFDQFARHLSNNTQRLVLADAWGNTIDDVTYADAAPWPTQADGHGPFLMLADPTADNSLASSWTTGTMLHPVDTYDTLHTADTLIVTDTLTAGDTIFVIDSTFLFDTTFFIHRTIFNTDTVVAVDTLALADTTVTVDTIVATPPVGIDSYDGSTVAIYPVPTDRWVTIVADQAIEKLELYSVDGKRLTAREPHTSHATIDLRHLPDGIYMLRIGTSGTVTVQKIIKTH